MTEDTTSRRDDLEALELLLATYGADRTRWPAPARLRFASLVSSDREAGKLLREARALDDLLDLMPKPEVAADAVARRIVDAAVGDGRAGYRRAAARDIVPEFARRAVNSQDAGAWAGGALLAASLVLGAFAGNLGVFDPSLPSFIGSIGSDIAQDADYEPDSSEVAFWGEEGGILEEDLL
jgi:hypothetical protein